jgi:F-type H+-transporting ATPase subunit b
VKRPSTKSLIAWIVVLAIGATPWLVWVNQSSAQEEAPSHAGAATATTAREGHEGAHEGHEGAAKSEKAEAEEDENAEPAAMNWVDFSNKKQPPYAAYLLNFGILLWIFWRMGRTSLPAALKSRRDDIARQIDEAQRIEKEAKARARKYQKKLENLDDEVEATKKALVEAGQGEKARLVREAEERAARMERDAKQLLENEMKQMQQDLTRETIEQAITAAEDLLKKRVTHADQERLAEEFLAQLGARGGLSSAPPAGAGSLGGGGAGGGKLGASIPPQAQTGGST